MMKPKRIALIGATGFVGGHLVARLAALGHQMTLFARQPSRHRDFLVLPQVRLCQLPALAPEALAPYLDGLDTLINLIGILNERGHDGQGFHAAHVEIPRQLIAACQLAGVRQYLHMSALHADAERGPSHYLRSKGQGEDLVHAAASEQLRVTSLRPSVIFGPGDSFCHRFAAILRLSPGFLPLACPQARFAPVYVGDVVATFVRALTDPTLAGQRIDLCGPHTYTLAELVRYIARQIGVRRQIIGLNDGLSRRQAQVFGHLPGKPFSLDNYLSLQVASVCADHVTPCPTSLESIVPYYLGAAEPNRQLQHWRTLVGRDLS